ncbi:hypothetical protein FSP39_014949 [Pinctada imbricata]|uniref:Peptidase M13 C-terminal domain-containing protein n=1 Tax=Pinctada imbricata TaxID=66713 RepID=A0AA89C7P0_PINIB|nr:hypothetical protein FSP39_014949 [Pinctada imbricata]
MAEKIGYPQSILNDTALEESFKHVNFQPDQYFENVLENIRSIALANSEKLRDPVDKSKWSTTPVVVNAFYSSTKNQIRRQFDKDGNLKQWWDDDVIERFKDMAQCIVHQYGNYTIEDVGVNLNGVQTQGENIADNGGLLEAYRAYEKWEDSQDKEPPRLPGITHLSNKHLFFLNFAQIWCGSMRPEAAINRLRTGLHSPGRFRYPVYSWVERVQRSVKQLAQGYNGVAMIADGEIRTHDLWVRSPPR